MPTNQEKYEADLNALASLLAAAGAVSQAIELEIDAMRRGHYPASFSGGSDSIAWAQEPIYPSNYSGVRQDTENAEAAMELFYVIMKGNTRARDLLESNEEKLSPMAYDFLNELLARRDAGSATLGSDEEQALILLKELIGWKDA